ncbi:MAG: hypothetical protein WCI47_02965 [bacterium]
MNTTEIIQMIPAKKGLTFGVRAFSSSALGTPVVNAANAASVLNS